MTKKRFGPDLVKLISIFSVIGVHFILNTMDHVSITTNFQEFIYFSYRQLFIICVPLFMLTSGYLNSKQPISRIYYKKIVPILGTYVFFSVLSMIFRVSVLNEDMSILKSIFLVLNFRASPYNWYLNMYIGLFLMAPFLNRMVQGLSRKHFQLLLTVLLSLTILPITVNVFPSLLFNHQGILITDFWISLYPITYYLTGYYIKAFPLKRQYLWTAFLVAIVSIAISIYFSKNGNLSKVTKDYGNILTYIQATIVFAVLINYDNEKWKHNSFIKFVASNTLEIYLISFISDQIVYRLGASLLTGTYIDFIFSPLFVIASFLVAILFVKVIQKFLELIMIFINRLKLNWDV